MLLLLRAVVKQPDLVVLDEAFSGMDEQMRDKCMEYLQSGVQIIESIPVPLQKPGSKRQSLPKSSPQSPAQRPKAFFKGLTDDQGLICISHVREEVPDMVRRWMCLPESNVGDTLRMGTLDGPLAGNEKGWDEIWRLRTSS